MKYREQYIQSYNIIDSFYIIKERQKQYWITKVPLAWLKAKKYKRDAKASTSQREQYGGTVHLFIGTGHNPCKITPMPFTSANNSIIILTTWFVYLKRLLMYIILL